MSLYSTQQDILTLLGTIPNVQMFEDEAADEVVIEMIPGSDQIKPFFTVSFGGLQEAVSRNRGIVGAKSDGNEATIVIQGVGSTKDTARQVHQLVWDKLIGYVPTNCGEIRAALYGGTGKVSSLGNPSRFAAMQSYRFVQNSDTIGS